jgi:hypothetical protein
LMAERHGMFDLAAGGMKKDSGTYDLIRTRADANFLMDPFSKCPMRGDRSVPYLPDPLARGASLGFLDRHGKELSSPRILTFFPDGADWPEASSFRLRVVEAADKPDWEWSGSEHVLTVRLPKAEVVTLRVSSQLGEKEVGSRNEDLMGIWQWISEASPSNLSEIRGWVREGRTWLITPFRDVTLVHAVQQPLIAPQFHSLAPTRLLGATYAYVADDQPMIIDGKSTVKTDIEAEWDEPLDDVTQDKPTRITGQAHVFEYDLAPDDQRIAQTLEPIFLDEINLHVERMSTMLALQPEEVEKQRVFMATPFMMQATNKSAKKSRSKTVTQLREGRAELATGSVQARRMPVHLVTPPVPTKTGYCWRHDFGDTKYRAVKYRAVASSRFREYFPPTNAADGKPTEFTRQSASVTVDIPNSARPAAPKVLYVIPTFAWEKHTDLTFSKHENPSGIPGVDFEGVGVVSKRLGGGLRVYLDRPWYSSGDGELLGVLLWAPGQPGNGARLTTGGFPVMRVAAGVPEELTPYVTQWGMDPIFASNPTTNLPAVQNFARTVKSQDGLTIAELSDTWKVTVAGHKVEYDEVRRLWYCDLELDAGPSYFPFVRLALARYQPISVTDAHLSRVVRADFAQVVPDRTAAVVFGRKDPRKVRVYVTGDAFAVLGSAITRHEELEVSIETQISAAHDELGWSPLPNVTTKRFASPSLLVCSPTGW